MRRSTLLLRLACTLAIVALVAELVSLFWIHPLSFLLFVLFGGGALALGLLIYLYWLIAGHPDETPASPEDKE